MTLNDKEVELFQRIIGRRRFNLSKVCDLVEEYLTDEYDRDRFMAKLIDLGVVDDGWLDAPLTPEEYQSLEIPEDQFVSWDETK